MNLFPLINDEISLETTCTKVSDITIIYSLDNLVIFNGNCAPSYSLKYTMKSHDQSPTCRGKYSFLNLLWKI